VGTGDLSELGIRTSDFRAALPGDRKICLRVEPVGGKTSFMRTTLKCQVTLPLPLRRKHGIGPRDPVEVEDHERGILVRRAAAGDHGITEGMRRGGKVRGTTADILKLTRGDT
jgi:bifunctional DNA-binding transcriptional regulator/antitoxin component of YhaV-PrlF toxin-antitoxin module